MSKIVAVVGLGYVGLPLAVEFGKKFDTIGFDLSAAKIDSYRQFRDPTGEISDDELRAAARLTATSDPADLRRADFIIVAVPTPVDVGAHSGLFPFGQRFDDGGPAHEKGRHRNLRVHSVSRRDRRGLRPGVGASFGHALEAGFSCRLFS